MRQPDYPRPGQTVRWRYRLLGFPLTLIDRPQEVVPLERLRTLIALAFLRLDETYTLAPLPGRPEGTRLSVRLYIGNTLPVLRGAFDRQFGRGLASQTISESLRRHPRFLREEIGETHEDPYRPAQPAHRLRCCRPPARTPRKARSRMWS